MKNILYTIAIIALLAVAAFLVISPKNTTAPEEITPQEDVVDVVFEEVTAPISYDHEVNTEQSVLEWTASKKFSENYTDIGSLNIESGSISLPDEEKGFEGVFVFDMSSITATETGFGAGEDNLTNHLKGEDFFDVVNYPTARFVITDSADMTITGDLTIKGITKPIVFNISEFNEEEKYVMGSAEVDRLDYGIDFRADGIVGVVKEQVIAENFNLDFKIYYQ